MNKGKGLMTPFEIYIYTRLHVLRRIVQFLALAFIFVIPILNMLGFRQIIGTFYSISIGNLDIIDPALMLQTIFLTKEIYFPLLLAGIIPLILTLIFGKVFCGWVCPFNLIAEYTDKLRRKIRPGSVKISNSNPKVHYYWLVFGTFVMLMTVSGIPIITLISMPGLPVRWERPWLFYVPNIRYPFIMTLKFVLNNVRWISLNLRSVILSVRSISTRD
jgi:ferredoxin-type protein NapH